MEECKSLGMMKILGKKWVIVIIRELSESGKRFNELNKNVSGISSRTLSKRLKELQSAKIIKKQAFKEIPPRVEYSLTEAGKDLMEGFKNLDAWIEKWKVHL